MRQITSHIKGPPYCNLAFCHTSPPRTRPTHPQHTHPRDYRREDTQPSASHTNTIRECHCIYNAHTSPPSLEGRCQLDAEETQWPNPTTAMQRCRTRPALPPQIHLQHSRPHSHPHLHRHSRRDVPRAPMAHPGGSSLPSCRPSRRRPSPRSTSRPSPSPTARAAHSRHRGCAPCRLPRPRPRPASLCGPSSSTGELLVAAAASAASAASVTCPRCRLMR